MKILGWKTKRELETEKVELTVPKAYVSLFWKW
jgi:hypothetical protein